MTRRHQFTSHHLRLPFPFPPPRLFSPHTHTLVQTRPTPLEGKSRMLLCPASLHLLCLLCWALDRSVVTIELGERVSTTVTYSGDSKTGSRSPGVARLSEPVLESPTWHHITWVAFLPVVTSVDGNILPGTPNQPATRSEDRGARLLGARIPACSIRSFARQTPNASLVSSYCCRGEESLQKDM
jgi:hypothetical protein